MAFASHDGRAPARRRTSLEYRFYFAGVYLICLPIAALRWGHGLARPGQANPGVHRRAMREARTITPMIFAA